MTDKPRRLVVVSNRVADFTAKFQTGGLAVALGDALKASHGLWFGWSGEVKKDAASETPKVETVSGLTVSGVFSPVGNLECSEEQKGAIVERAFDAAGHVVRRHVRP